MARYIITREEYHNEYGVGKGASFYVKEFKPFLFFWKRWVYIKHETCGYSDCYQERTKFKSLHEARGFIKEVLCTGKERDGVSQFVMETFECPNI